MDQDFEAPPISGDEPAPLKELETEMPKQEGVPLTQDGLNLDKPASVKPKPRILIFVLVAVIAILIGIMIGIGIRTKNGKVIIPSPSPKLVSPSPITTLMTEDTTLKDKIVSFKKSLDQVDLEELSLNPPLLDFNIRFKVED